MGSKHSKVNSFSDEKEISPAEIAHEAGQRRRTGNAGRHSADDATGHEGAARRLQAGEKKKRKRKVTLDPLKFQTPHFLGAQEAEESLRGSSLALRNRLTDSLKSVRSDASQSDASWLTDNSSVELIDYTTFEYPFENLVFEGGGNKGLAYAGAVREFERVGLWKNIRRLAGASAGAMFATLLAIGYNSYDVEAFLRLNLRAYFLDAPCGKCSLLPNLLRHFGWHPARRLFEWFGDRLEEMTGDADITFKQLYERLGKELCIVVTNLNHMDAEYCHVKTTPNMPIRIAVRMSLAIPGLFGAVKSQRAGSHDFYVDGGVLCNYPIHCYDGWWLSMKPGDSMLRRLQPLENIGKLWDKKERFGTVNPNTIGLLLYSSDEHDVMVSKLQKRNNRTGRRPDTKLSRSRQKLKQVREAALREHAVVTAAMSNFLHLLQESDIDQSGTITREELRNAFARQVDFFTDDQRRSLFGNDYEVDDIFDYLNHEKDDVISFEELMSFAEKRGVTIQTQFKGYDRRNIETFGQFLGALTDTLLVNVKRIHTTDKDFERTIGIDTVYIDTTDFELEDNDQAFLVEQGARAVRSYLRHYVRLNDPPLKQELRGGSVTESTLLYDDHKVKPSSAGMRLDITVEAASDAQLTKTNLSIHDSNTDGEDAMSHDRISAGLAGGDSSVPVLRVLPPLRDAPSDVNNGCAHEKDTQQFNEVRQSSTPQPEGISPSPSRDRGISPEVSPRTADDAKLVRVKRGTRRSEVPNVGFEPDNTPNL